MIQLTWETYNELLKRIIDHEQTISDLKDQISELEVELDVARGEYDPRGDRDDLDSVPECGLRVVHPEVSVPTKTQTACEPNKRPLSKHRETLFKNIGRKG